MFCKKCGQQLSDNEGFCSNCGTPVNPEQAGAKSENGNKSNILVMFFGGLIAVVLVVTIIVAGKIIIEMNNTVEVADGPETTQTVVSPTPTPTQQQLPPPATPVPPTPTPQVIIVTQQPAPVQVEETIVSVMYVVKCNNYITLRKSPSTSAGEITKIPLGASVGYISSASNGFYKVSYNGKQGYALAAYLSSSPYSYTEPAANDAVYMKVVNCNEWISLRKTSSTSAARITTIPLGEYVEYLGTSSNGFYMVKYNGYVGYALAKYLR